MGIGRAVRRAVVATVAVAVGLVAGSPAGAVIPDPIVRGNAPANAELVLSNTGAGMGVTGSIAPVGFNPLAGYPATGPPPGSTPAAQAFAGVIIGRVPSTGALLSMYCIDLLTPTQIGFGYTLGEWSETNVPNVGYVARLLNGYYPNTALPALANNNLRAAAVQASIWYFTDRYVVLTSDPLFSAVSGIVADILAAGPLVQPPAPTVDVAPPGTTSGPIGSLIGPFTVTSNQAAVTVTATSGAMFSDAAGTVPVANGAAVPSGTQLWLRGTAAGPATIRGSVSTVIQSGTVYLYTPENPVNPNPPEAQTLILAQQGTVSTLDEAQATFFDQGSLIVTKTISGNGAPFHGTITIRSSANGSS